MGLISLPGVNFSRRVTASSARGALALGRRFFLLEAWGGAWLSGAWLSGGWLGFPGLWALDSPLRLQLHPVHREGLGETQGDTVPGLQEYGFSSPQPMFSSLVMPRTSLRWIPKSPPSSSHLPLPLSSTPTGPTSSWTSWLRQPTDTSNATPPKRNPLLPRQLLLPLHLGFQLRSVRDASKPPIEAFPWLLSTSSAQIIGCGRLWILPPQLLTPWTVPPSLLVLGLF